MRDDQAMSATLIEPKTAGEITAAPRSVMSTPPEWNHAGLPEWFVERQQTAWTNFQALPMPSKKDENWRFADLKKVELGSYVPGPGFQGRDATAAVARSIGTSEPAARLVLGNDAVLSSGTLDDRVVVMPLIDALRTHGELIRKHFMAQPAVLGGAKLYALHAAALRGGVFVHVPAGVEVRRPVELHQWLGGIDSSTFPHTLIVADRHAKVTVVDYFQSLGSEPGFVCGVTDLAAAEGASINYVCCQRWSRKVKAIHFVSTVAGRDASVKSTFVELGSAWSRTESCCVASGSGSRSEMLSLAVAEGTQEIDCRTRQIHHQPQTFSDLLFKNVLFDSARTIFSGLIYVEKGAHYTDAYQTCRNLVLSEEAEANALPGLEINADQVKCSHGATSGPLSEEQIHYLRSRGIPEATARHLLAFGFCLEVIERIGHAELEAVLIAMIEEKFRRMSRTRSGAR